MPRQKLLSFLYGLAFLAHTGILYAQTPSNDTLANATILSGTNVLQAASTINATVEPGEPAHAGTAAAHSIWFSWTAPDSGSSIVDLKGSVSGTRVAVYVGKYLNTLSVVSSNSFANADGTGRCLFKTTPGAVYDIAVDASTTPGQVQLSLQFTKSFFPPQIIAPPRDLSVLEGGTALFQVTVSSDSITSYQWRVNNAPINGATNASLSLTNVSQVQAGRYEVVVTNEGGTATASANLTVNLRPANDDFGRRAVLTGSSTTVSGTDQFATSEPGEPSHAGWPSTSVWWTWTAPTNGQAVVTVANFTGNQVLAVYSGNSLTDLKLVASNAWFSTPLSVQFPVSSSTAYQIAVAGANGSAGTFDLNLSFTALNFPPVITQHPTDQTVFQGANATFTVTANSLVPLTYQWQRNGSDIQGATGPSLILTNVTTAETGAYQVLVSNSSGSVKSSPATLTVRVRPPNDDFVSRVPVSGNDFSAAGSNLYATPENGEPSHAGSGPGASVWWTWKPPVIGEAIVEVTGFSGAENLGIYQGAALNQLTLIRSNASSAGPLLAHFSVYPSNEYQIAIADPNGNGSGFNLHTTLLTSNYPPVIETGPYDTNVTETGTLLIPVIVRSDFRVHFQWFFNGVPIKGGEGWGSGGGGADGGGTGGTDGGETGGSDGGGIGIGVGGGGGGGGLGSWDGSLSITNVGFEWDGIYSFIVTNYLGVVTSKTVRVTLNTRPPNDDFANRVPFSGTNLTVSGTTRYATLEKAEPNHSGLPSGGGGSVWWSWQAPADGTAILTATKTNSGFQAVDAYTGTTLGTLTSVASGSASQKQVSTSLPVTAGTTYQIAVSGGDSPVQLALQFISANVPPQILQQPVDATAAVGGRAVFQVLASGGGSLNYQWFFNDSSIAGATNSSLQLTNVSASQQGSYEVIVSNRGGTVTSNPAKLTVNLRPPNDNFADRIILTGNSFSGSSSDQYATLEAGEPAHASWGPGNSVWWSWTAPASGILTVQVTNYAGNQVMALYKGGFLSALSELTNKVWFSGSLAASIPVSASNTVQIAVAGVSGSGGSFNLKVNFKEIIFAPQIVTQPISRAVTEGQSTSFSVVANGDSPLRYQWFFNSKTLDGKTNATLQLDNVQANQEGMYSVTVSNGGGSVPSLPATLTVNPRPVNDDFAKRILLTGATVVTNGSNRFGTSETGEPAHGGVGPFATVWYSYTAPAFGILQMDLTNSFFGAVIAVYTGNGVSQLALVASNSTANADGTGRVSFLGQPGTIYQIAIQGVSGLSGPIRLSISGIFPPTIKVQPNDQALAPGEDALFGVVAESQMPLRYQWLRPGGAEIFGETNQTLLVQRVSTNDLGQYSVRVANDVGSVVSQPATLRLTTVLKGQITDAIDGRPLPGVTVSAGAITNITDANGTYHLGNIQSTALKPDFDANVRSGFAPLSVQFFDQSTLKTTVLIASTNGYYTYTNTQVSITSGVANTNSFSLSPILPAGTMRLVLNWGGEPRDLDAHLLTPVIQSKNYHVYYQTGSRGSLTNVPFTALDIDRTNGFGPETITIQQFFPGSYHYYVRKFAGVGNLAGSGATVKIYTEAGLVRTVKIPESGSGEFWDVCAIDGSTRQLTVVNQVGDSAPGGTGISGLSVVKNSRSLRDYRAASDESIFSTQTQSGGIARYLWDFGDGATSSEINPAHVYTKPGFYTVGLTITDTGGASQSEIKTNFIQVLGPTNQPPSISLTSPINGSTWLAGANLPIAASASDSDGTVTEVRFFNESGQLAVLTAPPYNVVWPTVLAGKYLLTAVAKDNGGLTSTSAPVTVQVQPLPALSVLSTNLAEGNDGPHTILIPVRLSGSSVGQVSLGYRAISSTASAPSDFTTTSGTLIFLPGETEKAIGIEIAGDRIYEADETLQLAFSNVIGATGPSSQVDITILNDDAVPELRIGNVTLVEGDQGTTDAVFQVSLTGASSSPVSVSYETRNGTALAGADYLPKTGTLVFDSIIGAAAAPFADEPPLLHISDSPAGIVLTWTNSGDAFQLEETASLGGEPWQIATNRIVIDGTLQSAQVTTDGKIRFYRLAGSAATGSVIKTIRVPVIGDKVVEDTENFFVVLSGAVNANIGSAQGEATIIDNDQPLVNINDISVTEGNTGTVDAVFTVTLSSSSPRPVNISFATADGTAKAGSDYDGVNGTLSFSPGETTKNIIVKIRGDGLFEGNEIFSVQLGNPVNAEFNRSIGQCTIIDNETTPGLSINDITIVEGNAGTTNAQFMVTLSAPSAQTVTVAYATADGTARAGSDYDSAIGTLVFNSGETSKTINVLVHGDSLREGNESFSIQLSAAANTQITRATGQCIIVDDDSAPVLAINDTSVREGNAGTTSNAQFVVTLSAPSAQSITVAYTSTDGTAKAGSDYDPAAGTLVFNAGETSKVIGVTVRGDALYEGNENFTVQLSSAINAQLARTAAQCTIVDDDSAPSLTINDVTVSEGNAGATADAQFAVTLSTPSAQPVTVNYATVDGTAKAGGDYDSNSGTLVFSAGETSKVIDVAVRGDTLYEGNENFTVQLSAASNAQITRGTAQGTIIDDDLVPTITINDATVREGNAGTTNAQFTVTLSGPSAQSVTVAYKTVDGSAKAGADYDAAASTLVFNAGETSKVINVVVRGDFLYEGNENFSVQLSAPANAQIARGSGQCTVLDDDTLPALSIDSATVVEGSGGTTNISVAVHLSGPAPQPVSVNYATADGTAQAGADYLFQTGTLTFAPGETSKTITVSILGDTVVELSESFVVNLSGAANAAISGSQANITILDDDGQAAPPEVSITNPENDDTLPVGSPIVITANVSPGSSPVDKIEFFANGQSLGVAPYARQVAISWNNAVQGSYILKAVAHDVTGKTGESVPVRIQVVANDGKKRVAIVQNFPDAEISKLQAWLKDMDLSSRVFNQEGLTFELLSGYDLVIWDDLGTVANGLTANDVAIFNQVHNAGIPLYLIGSKLVQSGAALDSSSQTSWNRLLHMSSGGTTAADTRITIRDERDAINNGPFGLVGEFKAPGLEAAMAAVSGGEQVVARTTQTDAVISTEDAGGVRTLTQDVLAFQGSGLNAAVQREKLFKNSVWWLLRLPPPPPFLNLGLNLALDPQEPLSGQSFSVTATVQHNGEAEASGVTLTMVLPPNVSFVSATSEAGECVYEEGVVICFLGKLSQSGTASASIVLRWNTEPTASIFTSVSPNQPEARTDDNAATIFLGKLP